MFSESGILQKVFFGIFLVVIACLLIFYFIGYDASISWQIQAQAHSENFIPHVVQKGPFQFDLKGYYYTIAEAFSADPIHRNFTLDFLFLAFIFLGINTMLAVATTLSRYWFIGIAGSIVFLLFSLHLDDLGIFGFSSANKYGTIVIFIAYMLPAYLFHEFWKVSLLVRIIILNLISLLLFVFTGVEPVPLAEHLISNAYFSLLIISLLFLFIIAEENVFGILLLVTRTKGGKNNHRHFIFFGLLYLLMLGLYYGKKSGLIPIEVYFFDPYLLLALSSLVACRTLWYKRTFFENIMSVRQVQLLFFCIGITSLSYVTHAIFRGNDPVYQGYNYFVIYSHFAFGAFFFFYIILNFITPLSNGLQVFKIAYHSQNFPYISARLAGLVAVTAFFFLSGKAAYLLFQSGYYNYLGAAARTSGNEDLAIRYFEEGRIYGHDNHFSNYQLGHHYLAKKELELANHRFYRATLRYPSPQAFINQSRTDLMLDNTTPALVDLKTGLLTFPDNGYLTNNLGLLFAQQGSLDSARKYLRLDERTGSWNNANQTNFWMVSNSYNKEEAENAYKNYNLSVKGNIIANLLSHDQLLVLPLDTAGIKSSPLSLHKGAYLVNYAWINQDSANTRPMLDALSSPLNDELFRSAKQAVAINAYLNGQVNLAFDIYDGMIYQSANYWQGQFQNQKGLLALEQHALNIANEAFHQAIAFGNEDAKLNLLATTLESGHWDEAYQLLDDYAVTDDFYSSLKEDLTKVSSGKDLVGDELNFYAYYFYDQMEISDLSDVLMHGDSSYIKSLWTKIKFEQIDRHPGRLITYLDLFKSYLNKEEITFTTAINDLMNGKEVAPDQLTLLTNKVQQNALHPSLVIAVAHEMSAEDNLEAYNLLLNAMTMHEDHVGLIKAYIDESIKQGLLNYAESTLVKLYPLMVEKEFLSYRQTITSQIAEIRSQGF